MPQLDLDFSPRAVHNVKRLKGQSQRLFEYLQKGNAIHVFHPAKRELQIGYINSRISDLVKAGINIHKRWIEARDVNGELVTVREYSLQPFSTGH